MLITTIFAITIILLFPNKTTITIIILITIQYFINLS